MARSKNKTKMSAAKRRKKALKRKKVLGVHKSAPPPSDDAMGALAALFAGLGTAGPQDLDFNRSEPPPWACATAYTPAAARMVLQSGSIPGMPPPPGHHRAKLRVWLRLDDDWGLERIRQRTDAELLSKLAAHGVDVDAAELRRRASGHPSAWRLGEALGAGQARESDIVPAITTELWRRWLPDLPCYEGVCDAIQMGYPLLDASGEAVVPQWMAAWRDLQSLLPREINRFKEADQETGVLQMLGNWVGDMLDGVNNVARTDAAFVPDALAFVRWVKRFEDGPSAGIVADEAELLTYAGRREEGVRLLEDWIALDPTDPMPHARLSDLFVLRHPNCTPDPARAVQILRDALARPVRDPDQWDLESRLKWAESRMGS